MTQYIMRKDGELRTDAYQFTVDSINDPAIAELRRQVREHNKRIRKMARKYGQPSMADNLRVVRLMPRGPRREHAGRDYPEGNGLRSSAAYDSYLPMIYGTHFDVYIQKSDKSYDLKLEIKTGVSPGQRRRIARFEDKMRKQSWAFEESLRDEGLYLYKGEWYDMETAISLIEDDGHHAWADRLKEDYYG